MSYHEHRLEGRELEALTTIQEKLNGLEFWKAKAILTLVYNQLFELIDAQPVQYGRIPNPGTSGDKEIPISSDSAQ